jgi:dolichyl-diphosphooligosaccharide--protein glycosyltransferase
LQVTAASIHWLLNDSVVVDYLPQQLSWLAGASLNDICVLIPAGFSVLTCLFTAGLTYEVSGSANAGVVAASVMAVIPAHLMRSVAGGFDNESIAVAAICCTFYFWVRSLRQPLCAPLTALSYVYMVAAWGGYVFVLNMIGVHAALLVLLPGALPDKKGFLRLWFSYSCFYVLGTYGAIQFPVVGLAPLRSLEQLGPMAVFLLLQLQLLSKLLCFLCQTGGGTPDSG